MQKLFPINLKKKNLLFRSQPFRHEPELNSTRSCPCSRPPWALFQPDPIFFSYCHGNRRTGFTRIRAKRKKSCSSRRLEKKMSRTLSDVVFLGFVAAFLNEFFNDSYRTVLPSLGQRKNIL